MKPPNLRKIDLKRSKKETGMFVAAQAENESPNAGAGAIERNPRKSAAQCGKKKKEGLPLGRGTRTSHQGIVKKGPRERELEREWSR